MANNSKNNDETKVETITNDEALKLANDRIAELEAKVKEAEDAKAAEEDAAKAAIAPMQAVINCGQLTRPVNEMKQGETHVVEAGAITIKTKY